MNLLLNESPLIVLPSLAAEIGLNEAMMLQQIHYWLNRSENIRDGHRWVYKSVREWQKEFPFWSTNTIDRTLKKLEKQELIIVGIYNKYKTDRTKWYTIDYSKINDIKIKYDHNL